MIGSATRRRPTATRSSETPTRWAPGPQSSGREVASKTPIVTFASDKPLSFDVSTPL
jgi:hypothetical protein